MAERDAQYDPYIPASGGAPAGNSAAPGNQRTAALQAVSISIFQRTRRSSSRSPCYEPEEIDDGRLRLWRRELQLSSP